MKRTSPYYFLIILILPAVLAACSAAPTNSSKGLTQPVQPSLTSTRLIEGTPLQTAALLTATMFPTETTLPLATSTPAQLQSAFDKDRAYQDVLKQDTFGPRLPGSEAHASAVNWMVQELEDNGWEVEIQDTTYRNQPVKNVIARRGTDKQPWVILGAHYDSRFFADHDPDPANHDKPVPGANDGASGVAVLMELARALPKDLEKQVWLVFFDSEDQGQIEGWDWILGSRAFAESLQGTPESVVIVDMIGDADLSLPKEQNSNQELVNEVWSVAEQRGHGSIFLNQPGYSMLDDHTPFLEKGLRAIDIIDFSYPYWHTVDDTPDKVSPDSLFAVGDTLFAWLAGEN